MSSEIMILLAWIAVLIMVLPNLWAIVWDPGEGPRSRKVKKFICFNCKKPIWKGQYLYKVKLDDGSEHYSHGGECLHNAPISLERIPMRDGDWWVKRLGKICPTCGNLVEEDEVA